MTAAASVFHWSSFNNISSVYSAIILGPKTKYTFIKIVWHDAEKSESQNQRNLAQASPLVGNIKHQSPTVM
jgi:ABC-type uncharacterized transport system YnjBCD permease subunit